MATEPPHLVPVADDIRIQQAHVRATRDVSGALEALTAVHPALSDAMDGGVWEHLRDAICGLQMAQDCLAWCTTHWDKDRPEEDE